MRSEYPGFAVVFSTPWIVIWHGELVPYAQPYSVQILYCSISLALANIQGRMPHVEVIEPLLGRRSSRPEQPIPHVWFNPVMPSRPRLCLNTEWEWTTAMYIADTIVPWAIEWLAAYEGWRATGTWYAGGHNSEREHLRNPRRHGR